MGHFVIPAQWLWFVMYFGYFLPLLRERSAPLGPPRSRRSHDRRGGIERLESRLLLDGSAPLTTTVEEVVPLVRETPVESL